MNVRIVATIEIQDRPHHRAHLLALHVGGVTGDTQRAESHQGRDHRVVSAGDARCLVLRHGPILSPAGFMSISAATEICLRYCFGFTAELTEHTEAT
jgi:hypothetical protein